MNPNVLSLYNNIPKCPICLGYLQKPIKSINCRHIFCELCLNMWLQKKSECPLCRAKIDDITKLYFPNNPNNKNHKLDNFHYNIKYVQLDNFGKYSQNCLVCGKEEPKEELISCDCCNFFQSHFSCDPPIGLLYGKFFCRFCRKKFIDSLKSKK